MNSTNTKAPSSEALDSTSKNRPIPENIGIKTRDYYFTTKQAADYLCVSHQYLEISRCKGGGPPFIKLSRLVRYKRNDLDEWMNKHRQNNTLGSKVGVVK